MSIKGGKPNEKRIVAHLMVPNGREAVDYYRRAFDAQVLYASEVPMPEPRIVHAQIRVAESVLLLTEEMLSENGEPSADQYGVKLASPKSMGGTTFMLELYVDDVDSVFKRAVEAGGDPILEPEDMFYGDRYGIVKDPFGHLWALSTVKEELTPEEVDRRAMERFATVQ
jgi:uncharacterized glyoxalase superfamily protein PhnB